MRVCRSRARAADEQHALLAVKAKLQLVRQEREELLQAYRDNEVTLARLRTTNRELMREVALLKSGAPVPRVGTGERSAGVHTCDGGV